MKIKNKLIPLIGVATTVATIAPLSITSCKLSKEYITEDLTETYYPTIDPIETDVLYNQKYANELYFNKIEENKDIFHQDFAFGMFQQYQYSESRSSSYTYNLKKLNVSHTNPTFNTIYIAYPGEGDFPYTTITFSMNVEWEYEEVNSGETVTISSVKKSISADYNNIPFFGSFDTNDGLWNFGTRWAFDRYNNYIFQYNTSDYSLSYNYSETVNQKVVSSSGTTESTTNKTESNVIDTYKKVQEFANNHISSDVLFQYGSNYMSKVSPLPEVFCNYGTELNAGTDSTSVYNFSKDTGTSSFYINYYNAKIKSVELKAPIALSETTSTETSKTTITFNQQSLNQLRSCGQYGVYLGMTGELATAKSTAGTYVFTMPKSFDVTITALVGSETLTWDQTVYTNINSVKLVVTE